MKWNFGIFLGNDLPTVEAKLIVKFLLPIFLFLVQPTLLFAQADWPPLTELVTRAEKGDEEARVALAFRNYDSQGITREPAKVYQAFAQGVRLGIPDAYAGLALCYLYGWGTTWDSYKAYRLARLAVDLGSAKGHLALGVMAMEGQPARHMKERAREYLTKAAELGDLEARHLLATHRFEENGRSHWLVEPQALEKLAAQGHEGAIFSLVAHHRNRDQEKFEKYLKQGLELENPKVLMGQAFDDVVNQNFETPNTREENLHALDSYRRAAARGNRVAMFRYAYGLFLHPDLAPEGEDWREVMAESARLGQISACDVLARSYYKPKEPGVDPDYAKAAELLLGTLDEPNAGRYQTLGLIYLDGGYGVSKNPERAFKLLAKYANQTPYVYRMLGRILTDWEPLQGKDAYKIRAYACYLRYQELAPEPREGLFEERTAPLALTAGQIARARKLANEGYPTKPGDTLRVEGDGPYAPENLARDAVKAYGAGGAEALGALLDDRLDEFHLANPRAPHLFQSNRKRFLRLYREAQTGSGRNDPALAAAIYGWIYDNARKYPVSFGRIVVLYNYYLSLSEIGQRGRARDLLNEVGEVYALTGLITDPTAHPEDRSFPVFPEVNVPDYRGVESMGLNQVALVHLLATQSFVEGNWKNALSQAQAGLDLVTHKLDTPGEIEKRRHEWTNHIVSNRATIARIYDLLQFHKEADELRVINIESKMSNTYDGRSRLIGKVANERNEILRGKATPERVDRLRGLLEKIGNHPYLVRRHRHQAEHALILALFAIGQTPEAWELLEAGRKRAPAFLPFHLLWVERKIESNELDGLEGILISQLESVRRQGEKVSEYQLYLLYAQFLKASGRLDEAIRIQSEAIRLLQSFDLYPHLPSAILDLAKLYSLAGSPDEAERQRARVRQWLDGGWMVGEPCPRLSARRLKSACRSRFRQQKPRTPLLFRQTCNRESKRAFLSKAFRPAGFSSSKIPRMPP